jgi:hypothetical protein
LPTNLKTNYYPPVRFKENQEGGCFFLQRVVIQINITIFAALLQIFQEYPQSRCGFSENIRSQFEEIQVHYVPRLLKKPPNGMAFSWKCVFLRNQNSNYVTRHIIISFARHQSENLLGYGVGDVGL